MKKLSVLNVALLLTVSCIAGCGGAGESAPSPEGPPPEVSSDAQLKERLEFIANNGGMGSAFAGIKEMCEKSGKKDLVADAAKLESAQSSDAAKAIAKGMLGKL